VPVMSGARPTNRMRSTLFLVFMAVLALREPCRHRPEKAAAQNGGAGSRGRSRGYRRIGRTLRFNLALLAPRTSPHVARLHGFVLFRLHGRQNFAGCAAPGAYSARTHGSWSR
jgi:hypothetical protein